MDVLVVEDDSIARMSIVQTLSAAGYRVTTAADGLDAWNLLQETPHQLVVSDWGMPRMDGIELCRRIRTAHTGRYVYFILLTSHVETEDTIQGLDAGADDYIKKPFNPGELVLRVNTGRRIIGLETRGVTVFALAKLAESRDSDTGTHLERVRCYCRVLAERLQRHPEFRAVIDDEYVQLIYETSPLHDIGKVAVPDAVLRKPGRLTEAEFEIMKKHTVHGAETLDAALKEFPNARFLKLARNIALTHHERFDGTGYPHGLAGQDIPLCGRIVALADVYDALTSVRPYKAAWSHADARALIVEQRGRHFDPHVVDAFLADEQRFVEILKELSRDSAAEQDGAADAVDSESARPIAVERISDMPSSSLRSPTRPFRALVVDDEEIARKMLEFSLAQQGFHCDLAADGEQADELLARNQYDLAVIDLQMPYKNGHALAMELLQQPDRPVIVIHTAVDHPRMTEDLLSRGVDDIVYKPTNYQTFAVRAKTIVELRRQSAEIAATRQSDEAINKERQTALLDNRRIALVANDVHRLAANADSTTEEILAAVEQEPLMAAEMLRLGRLGTESETARHINSMRELLLSRGRHRVAHFALLAAVRCIADCIDPPAAVLADGRCEGTIA